MTEFFRMGSGVGQGCVMSCLCDFSKCTWIRVIHKVSEQNAEGVGRGKTIVGMISYEC